MIAGKFIVQGFMHTVVDRKAPDGKELKMLCFKDAHGQAEFHFIFSKEEFERFIQECSRGTLVIASKLPKGLIAI